MKLTLLKCPRCGYEFDIEIKDKPSKEPEKLEEDDFEKIVDTSITLPDYP